MAENTPIYGLRRASLGALAGLALLAFISAVLFSAMDVAHLPGLAGTAAGDFDAFYAVARLALEGRLTEAYDLDAFKAAQADLGGQVHQMTWTYPPPFDLVLMPLGMFGPKAAYLVFTVVTLVFYLWALRKLSGPYFALALLAAVPATLISLRTGQNGCMMAGLAAMTCHYALSARSTAAGTVLGFMIIKPHVGLGLGLWSIFAVRWAMALIAVIVACAIFTSSLRILGPEVWDAFVKATKQAGQMLSEGRYPHFRMASVYASFRSFGVSADQAFAFQIGSAIVGLAGTVIAAICLNARSGLAVALFMIPTVSPYMYDYDLVIYGPAFALLLAEMDRDGRRILVWPAVALAWIASGTGLVQNTRGAADGLVAQSTLAGIAAVFLGLFALGILWRNRTE